MLVSGFKIHGLLSLENGFSMIAKGLNVTGLMKVMLRSLHESTQILTDGVGTYGELKNQKFLMVIMFRE